MLVAVYKTKGKHVGLRLQGIYTAEKVRALVPHQWKGGRVYQERTLPPHVDVTDAATLFTGKLAA